LRGREYVADEAGNKENARLGGRSSAAERDSIKDDDPVTERDKRIAASDVTPVVLPRYVVTMSNLNAAVSGRASEAFQTV
jgi:hypothetical protein